MRTEISMLTTEIIKLSETRYQVGYPGYPNPLTIDFDRVLAAAQARFPDQQNFILKHWQARPNGQRRWGVFCWEGQSGKYVSYWPFEIKGSDAFHSEIQIEEGPPPTAVLCYPGAVLKSVATGDHRKLWRIESEYRSQSST